MILTVLGPLLFSSLLIGIGRYIIRLNLLYFVCISISSLIYFNFKIWLMMESNISLLILFELFHYNLYSINCNFIFDKLAGNIILIISIISFCIFLYSVDYIYSDPHLNRFIVYLYFFISFIFILVAGSNLVILFVGWEGVGLCSYLLISFWFTRLQALKAAIKAIFINKIGDICFLFGCAILFIYYGIIDLDLILLCISSIQRFSLDIINGLPGYLQVQDAYIFNLNKNVTLQISPIIRNCSVSVLDLTSIFFFIAICAKSAQIGLHTWLPAAIEGPTPVSALIHAATIVTAGIILFIRLFFLFQNNAIIIIFYMFVGGVTALLSAITAIFLFDIKKIIAYSTCSQLGYILASCGLFEPNIGFNHLINHAFFKALLFLTAGSIIHAFNNEQDIRYLKQIAFFVPLEYSTILVGNLCIIGFPFLTGFYSKDLILERSYLLGSIYNFNYIYWLLIIAAFGTVFYSLRLFIELFVNRTKNIKKSIILNTNLIKYVLTFLSLISIMIGYILNDIYYVNGLVITIVEKDNSILLVEIELLGLIKLLPLIIFILSLLFLMIYYHQFIRQSINFSKRIFLTNYYFNEFYNYIGLKFFIHAQIILINIDKGLLEYIGPNGLTYLLIKSHNYCIKLFYILITQQLAILYYGILIFLVLILI